MEAALTEAPESQRVCQREPQQGLTDLSRLIAYLEMVARLEPHKAETCAELMRKLRPHLDGAAPASPGELRGAMGNWGT